MARQTRITIITSQAIKERVALEANAEQRSLSRMAEILVEEGLAHRDSTLPPRTQVADEARRRLMGDA